MVPMLTYDAGVAGVADDVDHFGIGLGALEIGMDEYFAEAADEALVLVDVQRLAAEEDDAMIQQRLPDFPNRLLRQIL